VPERIFIGAAWPYANGPLHLGHVAGYVLPADIFARYHRARGNEVLMVSGSDEHGTPVALRADEEGVAPQVIADRYHEKFVEAWERLGVIFDLYTRTGTENHAAVVTDVFLRLLERGHIYQAPMTAFYCEKCARFLPDRYVQGTCPHCGACETRGDQCDACGKPLNADELTEPTCRLCGGVPELRETEHFFLDLAQFSDRLEPWIRGNDRFKPNVRAFSLGLIEAGLRGRPITRDIAWGIPVPVEGFESKRIYVWFEAVIGYLSASKEWAQRQGDAEAWRAWWEEPTKSYYFIGKDNIPFHTIIWPAMLLGYGDLLLPYDVPANEYLTLEHRPFSTSRNWAIWAEDLLSRYDPDPLRYVLSINMPESGDTDFSWREFVRRNNDELVAAYGNLVQRVLTITARNFEGRVPEPGSAGEGERALLAQADETFAQVTEDLAGCRFRKALGEIMALTREGNRYFDERAPWQQVKQDKPAAATTLNTCLQLINALKTMFYPFLPFSSAQLHAMLGFDTALGAGDWGIARVPAGQAFGKIAHLFKRLEPSVAEEEVARLEAQAKQSAP